MPSIRVLVIARDMLVRAGLSAILEDDDEFKVVGRSIGMSDTANDIEIYQPDIALLDATESDMDDELSAITQAEMPVILLAHPQQAAGLVSPLEDLSTYALLSRDSEPETILSAMTAVMDGLVVLSPEIAALFRRPMMSNPPPLLDALTARELDVLVLLAEGLPNKGIGEQLGISTNTVKFHVNAILSKLDAHSRTEAVVRATQLGLIFV
jgi:two-component system nitrate/nitrite response regulator NarL